MPEGKNPFCQKIVWCASQSRANRSPCSSGQNREEPILSSRILKEHQQLASNRQKITGSRTSHFFPKQGHSRTAAHARLISVVR